MSAVADRMDAGIRPRSQRAVDEHAVADAQSCRLGELGARPDPARQHEQVSFDALAVGARQRAEPADAVVALDADDALGARVRHERDAGGGEGGREDARRSAVELTRHRHRTEVGDRGHGARIGEQHRELDSEHAGPEHHHPAAALDHGPHLLGIRQVAQHADARGEAGVEARAVRPQRVESVECRDDRSRAGREHQPVIADVRAVGELDELRPAVDAQRSRPCLLYTSPSPRD